MDDLVGKTVLHYEILEQVGQGGMGVVYKAQDTKLNRTVALKFLTDSINKDDNAKTRFLQEAQSVAALNHTNICTIHGIEEFDGSLFMVMEYLDGGTINKKIPFKKINDALNTGVKIGEALHEAHSNGIVHRDIKADNIMLTSKGQVKVMDFGLAKLKGALKLTKTLSTVGTLGYMSPEQIQGGEADHRSDIFSFGVLLFEMLTGSLPFRGEHEAAIIYSVVNEEPQEVADFVPDLSPLVVSMIERCLEKDPEDRYQTMKDAVSDLRRSQKKSSGSVVKSAITKRPNSSQINTTPSSEGIVSYTIKKRFLNQKYLYLLATISVILAVYLFLFNPWQKKVEINPDMKLRVLDLPISDIGYPGLSGDGNWAAFPGKDAGGNYHVYFMNTSGGEPRAITSDLIPNILTVDVSYDGSRVVYDVFKSQSLIGAAPDIYISSSLGGGSKLIAQNAVLPRWQPDGKRIFYLSGSFLGNYKFIEIRSVTPEGTDHHLEFRDTISTRGRISLSISPDNKSIVWQRSFPENYQEIMIRDLSSGKERQLTFNKKGIDEVCWVSNNQIIFSTNKSGNTNLWMIPAEGGEQVQITKGLGPDLGIKISTNLKKLLYYQTQNYTDIWIGDLKEGITKQITFNDKMKERPKISPDGKQIAFDMPNEHIFSSQRSIYISNNDGSNRRQIASSTDKQLFLTSAGWSPDGSRISYSELNTSDSGSLYKTFVIEPGQGLSKFVADGGTAQFWLNSDSLLFYNNDKKSMWVASISKGTLTKFFEDSTYAFPLPQNKFVVYNDQHYNSKPGYWIVQVDKFYNRKGPAKKIGLNKFKNKGYKALRNSSSRDYRMYINGKGKMLRLWFINGKEELIPGSYPNINLGRSTVYFSISSKFSYSVPRTKGKLVMIDNLFK